MSSYLPKPLSDELPASYAHRVAEWYWSWNKPDKELGQFFTPLTVARFMAGKLIFSDEPVRLLDPGAGIGVLACAACEALTGDIELEAFEIDDGIAEYLELVLAYTQTWMERRQRLLTFNVRREDFILTYADTLYWPTTTVFDAVISNPPYFKLAKSDPRARAANRVVHGQPNIYALFMAVSAALLRDGGQAVFITPRSYAVGPYFSRFREYFFEHMRPRALHLFESRREVFDDVLQESLILHAERSLDDREVELSSSVSSGDFRQIARRTTVLHDVLGQDNILHLALTDRDDAVVEVVRSWSGNLHAYGMEISTGPVVPFRAESLVTTLGNVPITHVPLLWMQNVRPMRCDWPVQHKGQYIKLDGAEKLLVPNQNYVLLRRFSAKEERQRLTAAPYFADLNSPVLGIENHLNYIYRPGGELTDDETRGLAVLLNSTLMDSYFRIFSGHTQVNATELRNLPLPPLTTIVELGQRASQSYEHLDTLVSEVLRLYA